MSVHHRIRVIAVVATLAAAAFACPVAAAAAVLTPPVLVAAPQPPPDLPPGASATSTITLTNTTAATNPGATFKVDLPAFVAASPVSTPTVTLAPASGVACAAASMNQLVQVCHTGSIGAHTTVTVGTLTGRPPATVPPSGVSTSAAVAAPGNTVIVTWQWVAAGPPTLVAPPVISFSIVAGGFEYKTTTGTWVGTQPITYSYLWFSCPTGPTLSPTGPTPGPCTVYGTGSSLFIAGCGPDGGIEVVVTATNPAGSRSVTAKLGVIPAYVYCPPT